MNSAHSNSGTLLGHCRLTASRCAVALFATLTPVTALAQDPNTVTLRFANDQESMTGTLVEFRDNRFLLESAIGMVAIPTDGVICVGDACPEGTRLQLENARVTLTSNDGTVTINGDLIEVDGDDYVVATALGEQRISRELVSCEGIGCVEFASAPPTESKDVTLTNGEITLKGEFLGTEDGFYIVKEKVMGEVRVSTDQFSCDGPGCPAL